MSPGGEIVARARWTISSKPHRRPGDADTFPSIPGRPRSRSESQGQSTSSPRVGTEPAIGFIGLSCRFPSFGPEDAPGPSSSTIRHGSCREKSKIRGRSCEGRRMRIVAVQRAHLRLIVSMNESRLAVSADGPVPAPLCSSKSPGSAGGVGGGGRSSGPDLATRFERRTGAAIPIEAASLIVPAPNTTVAKAPTQASMKMLAYVLKFVSSLYRLSLAFESRIISAIIPPSVPNTTILISVSMETSRSSLRENGNGHYRDLTFKTRCIRARSESALMLHAPHTDG